jgi:hypothetical protein
MTEINRLWVDTLSCRTMRKDTDDHLIGEPELEMGALNPRRQHFWIDVTRSSVELRGGIKTPGTAPHFRARCSLVCFTKLHFVSLILQSSASRVDLYPRILLSSFYP